MNIGKNIQMLRRNAKISQAELGRRRGISQVGISRCENGTCYARIKTLYSIANALDVTLDGLLTGDFKKPSKNRPAEFPEKEFAARIREIRKSQGMSQDEFGKKCMISGATVKSYELGVTLPTAFIANLIATANNVTLEYLVTGSGRREDE